MKTKDIIAICVTFLLMLVIFAGCKGYQDHQNTLRTRDQYSSCNGNADCIKVIQQNATIKEIEEKCWRGSQGTTDYTACLKNAGVTVPSTPPG